MEHNNPRLNSPEEVAYYLYLQQAYKPHTDIPTREELLVRNPQYLLNLKKEMVERTKGPTRYFLKGYKPKKRPDPATKPKSKPKAKVKTTKKQKNAVVPL